MTLAFIAVHLFLPLLIAGAILGLLHWVSGQYPLVINPAVVKFITVVTVVVCVIFIFIFFFGPTHALSDIRVGKP
jgi:hypothetical protein